MPASGKKTTLARPCGPSGARATPPRWAPEPSQISLRDSSDSKTSFCTPPQRLAKDSGAGGAESIGSGGKPLNRPIRTGVDLSVCIGDCCPTLKSGGCPGTRDEACFAAKTAAFDLESGATAFPGRSSSCSPAAGTGLNPRGPGDDRCSPFLPDDRAGPWRSGGGVNGRVGAGGLCPAGWVRVHSLPVLCLQVCVCSRPGGWLQGGGTHALK
jgi:hypothetical protein